VRGQDQAERQEIRLTHHGPIVNQALGADDQQPLALRWAGIDEPAISQAFLAVLEPRCGPELVEAAARRDHARLEPRMGGPRHGSIGYKMVGRIPMRKGDCPDLPKPGWTGEFEWEDWIPYDELARTGRSPTRATSLTANNKVVDSCISPPHHQRLAGRLPRGTDRGSCLVEREGHDLDDFRRMQTDLYSIPGDDVVHRPRPSPAHHTARGQGNRCAALKSWDPHLGPRTVAGTIYQAFMLRLAREFTRAAIGDRDLAERYLDQRRQRLHRPRHLPLALAVPPAGPSGGTRTKG